MQIKDVIYAAARQARILTRAGSQLNASQIADGLTLANQIVDQWAARKAYAYSDSFTLFTLTPNHTPHLLGPGLAAPDFAVVSRPVAIAEDGAALVLTGNVDVPLKVRDGDWWNNQRVKSLTSNVPTDLYFSPDWPNAALYLWPVPAAAYGLRLRLRTVLQQFAASTTAFSAAPAYLKALTMTLAEDLCDWFGVPIPADLPGRAAKARATLEINNIASPRCSSADHGTARRGRGSRPTFNYYIGQ